MTYQTKSALKRFSANISFQMTRSQAGFTQLVERPFHRFKPLESFKSLPGILKADRFYLGEHEIPLAYITGSVRRTGDYDRHFRPLRRHLAKHWMDHYLRLKAGEWTPVKLYKYGENYYVEDGHHRLSAAQSLGKQCVLAEIWEIIPNPSTDRPQLLQVIPSRIPTSCCEERMVRI